DRGVRQGPFWVLHSALMPSILVELGFISNKEEGEYLNSEAGKNEMAKAIARAIREYKKSNAN
ncbi:MAG: N-acetylmuramoyl-L-alanine amidase, partial [Myroides sp.]